MTITRRLMKPGKFTLKLTDGTPKSIMQAIDAFDHVVVTRNRLAPIEAYTDANVLALAQYSGVIEELSRTANTLSGYDPSYWLGTPDGRGDLLDTAVSRTAGTLSAWIGDLRPSSIAAGTVTNTGTATVTASYQWMTRREAIDAVCRAAGAEWRVNPNFTLDAALPGTLFQASPEIVITRKPQGDDGPYRGVDVSDLRTGESASTYLTRAIVVGNGLEVGSATGSTTYVDAQNNAVVMEAFVNEPTEGDPAAIAAAVVDERNALRRELALSSRSYNVTRFVDPGDWVYVWDELADLVDQANQITYNGRLISPVALRVYAVTFPIERGCGVYVRKSGATPTYTDVTEWVEWETGDVRWEVGAAARPLGTDATLGASASLGVNPALAARAAGSTFIGRAAVGTSQGGITSATNLTGLSVGFDTPGGRQYKITCLGYPSSTVATDLLIGHIRDAADVNIGRWAQCPGQVAGAASLQTGSLVVTPAAGSVVYKMALERNAGTGTVTSNASSSSEAFIMVEDIGPA